MVHQNTTFKCRECGRFFPKSEFTSHENTCFLRSNRVATGVCVGSWGCKEKIICTGKIYCLYHNSEVSL